MQQEIQTPLWRVASYRPCCCAGQAHTPYHFEVMTGVTGELAERHVSYVKPRRDWLAGPEGRKADRVGALTAVITRAPACESPQPGAPRQLLPGHLLPCCRDLSALQHRVGNRCTLRSYKYPHFRVRSSNLEVQPGCRWVPPTSCTARTWRRWPPSGTTSPNKSGMIPR